MKKSEYIKEWNSKIIEINNEIIKLQPNKEKPYIQRRLASLVTQKKSYKNAIKRAEGGQKIVGRLIRKKEELINFKKTTIEQKKSPIELPSSSSPSPTVSTSAKQYLPKIKESILKIISDLETQKKRILDPDQMKTLGVTDTANQLTLAFDGYIKLNSEKTITADQIKTLLIQLETVKSKIDQIKSTLDREDASLLAELEEDTITEEEKFSSKDQELLDELDDELAQDGEELFDFSSLPAAPTRAIPSQSRTIAPKPQPHAHVSNYDSGQALKNLRDIGNSRAVQKEWKEMQKGLKQLDKTSSKLSDHVDASVQAFVKGTNIFSESHSDEVDQLLRFTKDQIHFDKQEKSESDKADQALVARFSSLKS